jgi:hypothetical protein
MGTGCTVMTSFGTTLCTGVSACPTVEVPQTQWKGCGFAIVGNAYVLACDCSGKACAAMATPTCKAAEEVLSIETSTEVCGKASVGECTDGLGGDAGAGACNVTCMSQCFGSETCLHGCGC